MQGTFVEPCFVHMHTVDATTAAEILDKRCSLLSYVVLNNPLTHVNAYRSNVIYSAAMKYARNSKSILAATHGYNSSRT